jgi:mannosyl-3-phosphoglycerate phosphatase
MWRMHWLIATDLDGTLLDDDYDLPAAAAAIDRQRDRGHHVVLASSKTLAEMREIAALCRRPPVLVFENGAGIAWPEPLGVPGEAARADAVPADALSRGGLPGGADPAGEGTLQSGFRVQLQGEGYPHLRALVRSLRRRGGLRFAGFADMSPREVAELTGLSEAAAARAQLRQATEPVRWLDSAAALATFRQALSERGYRLVEGGRFHHVMPRADKACAVASVARRLAELGGVRVRVLCCGDSANDRAMLRRADVAVIFPRPDGRTLDLELEAGSGEAPVPRIHLASAPGAAPWSRAVDDALRQAGTAPTPPASGTQLHE